MLDAIEAEIERRAAIFKHLDASIRAKFTIIPGSIWKRLRRNQVHSAIHNGSVGSGCMQRLVKEKLKSMGVGMVTNSGVRWFTCIEFKHED
jgi:hypothetical protein